MLSSAHLQFCDSYLKNRDVFVSGNHASIQFLHGAFTKYYVYFLIERETGRIFYIGKGAGRRVKRHFDPNYTENVFKSIEMDEIKERGNTPSYVIFHQTPHEPEAFAVERDLINALSCTGLTNEIAGCTSLMEKEKLKAKRLLEKVLPFDFWMSLAERTDESIDNYHFIVNELQQIVALP
jgi:hypothetical protein